MALNLDPEVTEGHRPVFLAVLGLILLAGGGFLLYTDLGRPATDSQAVASDAYHYAVDQSVDTNVHYLQSSFFNGAPAPEDQGFVLDLTKSIGTGFHYHFKASKSQPLTYSYSIVATVKATYDIGAGNGNSNNVTSDVWTKDYLLVPPKEVQVTTDAVTLDPTVDVPFAEYKKVVEEFKKSFDLPVTEEADIVAAFHVSGSANGTQFRDSEVQSVTTPLDQVIYKLNVKFDKSVTKDIAPASTSKAWNIRDHYVEVAAGVLLVLGLAALVYGLRRQIFKSPYQRELDRIYRYYDGIVIRANKPADMEGKNVVSVASFDDMLNLEEEMKLPIVASPAGSEAMHFVIMKDNDVYIYTLGNPVLDSDSVNEVEETLPENPEAKTKKPKRKVKVQ